MARNHVIIAICSYSRTVPRVKPQRRPQLPIMHAVHELVEYYYQCIKIAKALKTFLSPSRRLHLFISPLQSSTSMHIKIAEALPLHREKNIGTRNHKEWSSSKQFLTCFKGPAASTCTHQSATTLGCSRELGMGTVRVGADRDTPANYSIRPKKNINLVFREVKHF